MRVQDIWENTSLCKDTKEVFLHGTKNPKRNNYFIGSYAGILSLHFSTKIIHKISPHIERDSSLYVYH